ncbi:MAG: hypothetical protein ABFD98_17875 [Syntrophobacteraceae bacterium]
MGAAIPKIYFDRRDYELLGIVNDVCSREASFGYLKNLLYPYMHPRGIKEMAASRALRIAYSVVRLLESLEVGKADDRLSALRSLRDEVMHSAESHMEKNTARVLLQIMKDLARMGRDDLCRLQLAHDFRVATSGKPRIIRALLRRYHLLEMPEEWNQIAFDDHVHDSHTKGRKTPSHLIMDAWIKGIRHLTVIYYNYVSAEAAAELLEASEVMGITVRIGVELSARFHNRYVQLIWGPRGFLDTKDFLSFLSDPRVEAFMGEGRRVSEYQQRYVFALLKEYNLRHRLGLNEKYGLALSPLDRDEFRSFVGTGQTSVLHLGAFVHSHLLTAMQARVKELKNRYRAADGEERKEIRELVGEMNNLDSEVIVDRYLRLEQNPGVPDPNIPVDEPDVPEMLRLGPCALLERLNQIHSGYRITLNLNKLTVEDVLELLYDCRGAISHLEIFNLKDFSDGKQSHYFEINELQRAINDGNVIALKRHIRGIIQRMEEAEDLYPVGRIEKFKEILHNIAALQAYYKVTPLKARIGSDSTGRSRRLHGMGLVVQDTLPQKAQDEILHPSSSPRLKIPVSAEAYLRTTYIPRETIDSLSAVFYKAVGWIPVLRRLSLKQRKDWVVQDSSIRLVSDGNILSLGGVHEEGGNGLCLDDAKVESPRQKPSLDYLNSFFRNALKVFIGFVPAFATFALTKDWWLLAYFGAFIWFGITGLRNILQSVLGAGGVRRSPLLRWNSYVNWDRISDSLLYTGFSVPLLDYLVKTVILDRIFGVNTSTSPVMLYTVMALTNGIYISSHNAWRGLPKAAILGNLFRTVLSIPLAVAFNSAIGGILGFFEVAGVALVLQKWAAIISKSASDCVAGMIEGLADRYNNFRMRIQDYETKLAQLFDIYAQLELIFPEADVLKMLESPKEFIRTIGAEARDLEKIIIINALDLLYFWMYQPRARSVLCSFLKSMSHEERQILVRSQSVLRRKREISQLFVDGLVGKRFSDALSFYLSRSNEYLDEIEKLAYRPCSREILTFWPARLKKSCAAVLGAIRR